MVFIVTIVMRRLFFCLVSCFYLFAITQTSSAQELFGTGSVWRYFKGTQEASTPDTTAWRNSAFDHNAWLLGSASFYYGDPFSGTLLSDMGGNYSTVFLRKHFEVINPGDLQSLTLNAACDDGFICWINGIMVMRFNVPEGELPYNGYATTAVNPDPAVFNDYPILDPRSFLKVGSNIIAIQLFNTTLGSSDIVWDASLSYTGDLEAPIISNVMPTVGAALKELYSVEVLFSEPVAGVDAEDLLIGGIAATNVIEVTPGQFLFSFSRQKAGQVTVAFRDNHGITDIAGTPHPFKGTAWSYSVDSNLILPGVFISEFMTENTGIIRDEDGEKSDWIELFNSSNQSVSLLGWSLTDDVLDLRKWKFPSANVAGGGRLLVFASGKDRTNALVRLHTNFKLNNEGEYLALVNPAGTVESQFSPTYPEQKKTFSYGRANGSPNVAGFFGLPTPGTANTTSGVGFAPDVKFSINGHAYITNFFLAISLKSEHVGAEIRYTTNGTLPLPTSFLYTNVISVTNTVQIRARAIAPGVLPGDPHSEMYFKLEGTSPTFNSTLPVIVLHNFGRGTPPSTGQQDAYLQVYEPVGGITSFTNQPTFTARVGIGARGSSTLGLAKVSMNLELRNEFGVDEKHALLGLPEDSDWVLYAPNGFEPVLIHNPFMHQLSRDIGRYSSRTRFVEVFLVRDKFDGNIRNPLTYNGVYVLEERVGRSKDRIDIDKLVPENVTEPAITGGYMLKVDRTGPGEGGFNGANQGMVFVDPDETEMVSAARSLQLQYLRNYFGAFGTALYGANWTNRTNGYRAYIDVEAWIDHHLLNVLSFNVDALRLSTYFYKPRNGKITFGPLWDFDRALGSTDGRDANPKVWTTAGGGGTDYFNETSQRWWGRLFTDLEFYQQWIDRYQQLRISHFSTTNLYRLVDSLTTEVRTSQPRDQTKWGVNPRGGYQGEINSMKSWLSNRVVFMDSQSVSRPTNNTPSRKFSNSVLVSLASSTNGTIYYTLDGSDPRSLGGTINPKAMIAGKDPLIISTNSRLVARFFNNAFTAQTGALKPPLVSKWSGITEATYYNSIPPLLLTEIMYHPSAPSLDSTNTSSDFEYVELYNSSSSPLNLVGFQLTGGIQFAFVGTSGVTNLPPSGRVLVVKNIASFLSRYPNTKQIAGEFTGNLGNNSNRLIVTGPLNEPVSDISYDSQWAPLSDGFGFSLTLRHENFAPDQIGSFSQWRASTAVGGSPGIVDPNSLVIPQPLVNELLTHTDPPLLDGVEIMNSSAESIDISGWWLTDDYRDPKKYKMPLGSTLLPGGFLVVNETLFRSGSTGFSFSALGDSAYIFSANAGGDLTGYHHGFSFGATFNGTSLGRYMTSEGIEHFVTQETLTMGNPNPGPKVGPLVITEIHFEPTRNGTNNNYADEFIELRNVSSSLLPLWDSRHPTNQWHLRGGVDFDFPVPAVIAPGGFALVVGFNPTVDKAMAATFRSKFQVNAAIPLFGPWKGNLDNSGETLVLKQPDEPVDSTAVNAGEVPYISIEEIQYGRLAPWYSNAMGSGKSLQRLNSKKFGDDPVNWQAALPTAGKLNIASDVILESDDSDLDGLPDVWENKVGLAISLNHPESGANGDPDKDGVTNWEEYVAGSEPNNPASFLTIGATFEPSGILLRVSAFQGRRYTFWIRESMNAGEWKILTQFPTQTESKIITATAPSDGESRFYRVSVAFE